jgi:Tfp pilus assembly protein PilF
MALHFTRSNALLLLVPKTGSTWIRAKVKELGLEVEEVGDPAMREHDFLTAFDRSAYSFVGAFVRNPVDWYRSYWSYRMERGWRPQYPLDRHCESDDFETFVRRAVTTLPGALGNIYTSYVGEPGAEVEFVGRQESLAPDFARFLRLAGEDVDESVLLDESRVNETRVRPEFTEELKELITVSEWDTMERFGYLAERPDPIGLGEIRARYPEDANDLRLLVLWTERVHWAPDDEKKLAGRAVSPETRYARVHGNFALFAEHKRLDPDYAEERYRAALRLDPDHPRTLCNYACFLWKHRHDPDEARKLMLHALSARPSHPLTLARLARLTDKETGDPALAEILYRQSLAANPKQREVRVELASLLGRRGKAEEGLTLLRQYAEHESADSFTLVTFASLLVRSGGDPAEADQFRKRAVALAGPGTPSTPTPVAQPV